MSNVRSSAHRLSRREVLGLGATAAGAALLYRSGALAAQPAAGVIRRTLANGLVVLIDERRTAESVALHLSARAGSRDDGRLPGITAFTLRMMFAGTRRRPSQVEISRAAALVGGTVNGTFGTESGSFFSLVPAAEADVAFDLLADIVGDPLFSDAALTNIRQVALQVLQQRRTDPTAVLTDLYTSAIYAEHPAGNPVNGTPEAVMGFTRADVVNTHQQFWSASNLVLAIVGKVEVDEALAKAEQYFGGLPSGTPNTRPPMMPMPRSRAETLHGDIGQAQSQFRIGFLGPPLPSPDRFPMAVLNTLMSLRLFVEIRSERGLAYSAGSSYSAFSDVATWFATAGTDPGTLEQAMDVASEEIRRIREMAPSDDEVQQKIEQIVGAQVLADETNAARASRLAAAEISGDVALEEFVRRIRAVTAADVHRVAQTYLDLDRALTVIVGPRPTS